MSKAAEKSVNTCFIQLETQAGLCALARTADAAGVQRADGKLLAGSADQVAALTLGPFEVAPPGG